MGNLRNHLISRVLDVSLFALKEDLQKLLVILTSFCCDISSEEREKYLKEEGREMRKYPFISIADVKTEVIICRDGTNT